MHTLLGASLFHPQRKLVMSTCTRDVERCITVLIRGVGIGTFVEEELRHHSLAGSARLA